ncbi:MAG TPA: DUF4956 domain-containing protein [Blastocatellia bacterium]|nr:DUF4956 domain-containing protein [Blastocatellia bacterium]
MNYKERDAIKEDPSIAEGSEAEGEKDYHEDEVPPEAPQAVRRDPPLSSPTWRARLGGLASKRGASVGLLIAGVAVVAVIAYLLMSQADSPPPQVKTSAPPASQAPPREGGGLTGLFDLETPGQEPAPWPVASATITLKLALGALLATLLAFRPRRDTPITIRNPYVAQTQILLAIVAAALMMVVADNAARAFGIFAAASLVRFRTNIRDPKEITVLLISLAIGLATGVGKIEVAIILTLFSLIVVSLLEYYEPDQVFRSMELTVASRKVIETDEVLREIFEKRNIQGEMRKVDPEDSENPIGKIVYFLNVAGDLSTDKLSEEIFSSDPDNIDSIQWDQKKTSSYVYR